SSGQCLDSGYETPSEGARCEPVWLDVPCGVRNPELGSETRSDPCRARLDPPMSTQRGETQVTADPMRPHVVSPSRCSVAPPVLREWGGVVHVKVTMLFVVFDVRALVHGPLHAQPGVGVQQIPRAAEHDEPSYAPGIAEEGVEDRILSMLTDPELSEKQLSLLDQPRIHRLDLID